MESRLPDIDRLLSSNRLRKQVPFYEEAVRNAAAKLGAAVGVAGGGAAEQQV